MPTSLGSLAGISPSATFEAAVSVGGTPLSAMAELEQTVVVEEMEDEITFLDKDAGMPPNAAMFWLCSEKAIARAIVETRILFSFRLFVPVGKKYRVQCVK